MARRSKTSNAREKIVSTLKDNERALISIILMSKGKMPGPRLKRIYLEKYTYWELQKTEKKLLGKGLLLKKGGTESKEASEYAVPEAHLDILSKSFISKVRPSPLKEQIKSISMAPCGDYSILWYLWQMDSVFGYDLLGSKPLKSIHGASVKKIEELLGLEGEGMRFLIDLFKGLFTNKFFTENKYKKWSDMLDSPHEVVKEIFKTAFDMLKEGSELGRDDVGKDNMDFFFEELAALKLERWYSLETFVSNSKRTLFRCNQPYRWIHFDEESVWKILNQKLKLLGIVKTSLNKDEEKFFMPTILGSYFLGMITHKKIVRILSLRRGKFMVHPNFEVTLVSKELDPKKMLELAMFSDLTKLDTVSVFRISRESVNKGLRLGLTADEMISFLRENCKGEVPQNVEYSIGDWGD